MYAGAFHATLSAMNFLLNIAIRAGLTDVPQLQVLAADLEAALPLVHICLL